MLGWVGWGMLSWLSREVMLGERLKEEDAGRLHRGLWRLGYKVPTGKLNLTNFLPGVLLLS